MDFRPVLNAPAAERTPVPRGAADHLQKLIQDGQLRPGDRLPSQRALAERLGISRASLREALSVLETLGRISVQAGRGVFVAEPAERAPSWRFADRCTPRDVYEARYCVEGFAASLAAERLDEAGLDALRGTVVALRAAFTQRDIAAMAAADSAFHDIIIEACGNPMLASMYRSVREMMVESQRLPMLSYAKLENTVLEHEALLNGLEARDPAAASERMRRHIRAAASRLGVAL